MKIGRSYDCPIFIPNSETSKTFPSAGPTGFLNKYCSINCSIGSTLWSPSRGWVACPLHSLPTPTWPLPGKPSSIRTRIRILVPPPPVRAICVLRSHLHRRCRSSRRYCHRFPAPKYQQPTWPISRHMLRRRALNPTLSIKPVHRLRQQRDDVKYCSYSGDKT